MSNTDALGIPLEDSKVATKKVQDAYTDVLDRLFYEADNIREEFDLTDAQMKGLIATTLDGDIADDYADWCGE